MKSCTVRVFKGLLAMTLVAFASDHPNFSGTWKLNTAESNFPSNAPSRMIRVVEQEGPELRCTVERELNGKVATMDYQVTIAGEMPSADPEQKIWASWKGDTLVVTLVAANGTRQTENWALSQDRKRIVDQTLVRGPDGKEATIRRVFDRQ